ncbi:hypothetical protein [Desulfobacter latus]|uniref:Fibronectin type-III domain-containing protein n=1 Tax=Desulfobacter latus TaxID=2292 RepID=A0A850TB64_9BACT|nr:hypothetical protein [Desulfobacter latus]NWH04616.1 hypothetical protein [Desulfobacter latus]
MKRIFQCVVLCLFFILLGAGIFFMAAGCGKKGPPVPPTKNAADIPAAPTGLKYTLKDRDLTLSWRCASLPDQAQEPRVEGFEVFMATKPLAGCQGCPFIFKSLGVVPMPRKSFVYTLDQDLHYYFRVQTLGRDNIKSKVSDTLYIEFP